MDPNAPASRAELAELLEALESRIAARIDRTETRLLTAFHDWARPHEMRMRGLRQRVTSGAALVDVFNERLCLVEDRVSRIERAEPQ